MSQRVIRVRGHHKSRDLLGCVVPVVVEVFLKRGQQPHLLGIRVRGCPCARVRGEERRQDYGDDRGRRTPGVCEPDRHMPSIGQ